MHGLFSAIPDGLVSDDLRGKIVIDAYLRGKKKNGGRTILENRILGTPGTSQSVVRYLRGRGRAKMPEIVGKHLDGKWYRGPAKMLAKTHLADGLIVDKVLDDIAPSLHGTKDIAKSFIYAGGMV
jgi:hypothetical protein